jgi:hypothetical protein
MVSPLSWLSLNQLSRSTLQELGGTDGFPVRTNPSPLTHVIRPPVASYTPERTALGSSVHANSYGAWNDRQAPGPFYCSSPERGSRSVRPIQGKSLISTIHHGSSCFEGSTGCPNVIVYFRQSWRLQIIIIIIHLLGLAPAGYMAAPDSGPRAGCGVVHAKYPYRETVVSLCH